MPNQSEIEQIRTYLSATWEAGNYNKYISTIKYLLENKAGLFALENQLINLERVDFNGLSSYFENNFEYSIISNLCIQEELHIALEYAKLPGTIISPSSAIALLELIGHDTLDDNYDFANFTYILDKAILQNPGEYRYMIDTLYFILQDHSCATTEHANYIYSKLLEAEGDIDEHFITKLIKEISHYERCPDAALNWLESIGFNKEFLLDVVEEIEENDRPFERISEQWRRDTETRSYDGDQDANDSDDEDADGSDDDDDSLEAAAAPDTGINTEDMDIEMMPTAGNPDIVNTDYITNLLGGFNFGGNAQ